MFFFDASPMLRRVHYLKWFANERLLQFLVSRKKWLINSSGSMAEGNAHGAKTQLYPPQDLALGKVSRFWQSVPMPKRSPPSTSGGRAPKASKPALGPWTDMIMDAIG